MAHQPLGGRPVGVVLGSDKPFPTADDKVGFAHKCRNLVRETSNRDRRSTRLQPGAGFRQHRYGGIVYYTIRSA